MAQSIECPVLGLGAGLDLGIMGLGPALGSMQGVEPNLKKMTHTDIEKTGKYV